MNESGGLEQIAEKDKINFLLEERENKIRNINWKAAAKDARLGDHEPAYWVNKDFQELPELTEIPEPANSDDVMLVHWRSRKAEEKNIDNLINLPKQGEIATCLISRKKASSGSVGIILDPGTSAITEMHVTDINSAPGHEGVPEGQRKSANPKDRKILRQLKSLDRLTPEQVATIQIDENNEVFVESSRIKGVLGIIFNSLNRKSLNFDLQQSAENNGWPIYMIKNGKVESASKGAI